MSFWNRFRKRANRAVANPVTQAARAAVDPSKSVRC